MIKQVEQHLDAMAAAVPRRPGGRKTRAQHPLATEVVRALKGKAKRLDRRDPDRQCVVRSVSKGGTISLSTFLSLARKLEVMPGDLLAECVEEAEDTLGNFGQEGQP